MVIRSPRSTDEVMAVADVAAAAFGAGALNEPWRDRYAMLEQTFGRDVFLTLEVEGRFVSSITCIPAQVWMGDRRVTLGAVGGVATLPECRRQGYALAVLCAGVRRMHERGLATSALWPFSFPYYRKAGWDFAGEQRTYHFAPGNVGPLPEPEGVSPVAADDIPALIACYGAFGRRLAFCTDRHEHWWRELLRMEGVPPFAEGPSAGARMLVCREGGAILGYAVYAPPSGEPGQISVREMVALTAETRLRILAALAREAPAEIAFPAPASDRFRAQVPDPRRVAVTLDPGFAFRVVDPAAALSALTPPQELSGSLALTLHDPARPEAPLLLTVEAEAGHVAISTTRAARGRTSLCLAAGIPAFSQVYSGYLRPSAAHWLGKLEGDEASVAFAERLSPRWTAYRSHMEPG